MNTLERISERDFLFVTQEAKNKFRSIINSLEVLRPIALAHDSRETKLYRKNVEYLYIYICDVKLALSLKIAYTSPLIYTGILERLFLVINSVTINQPNSIFRMMNKMLVIKLELEKLIIQLRD
jgi:hypothetical protein